MAVGSRDIAISTKPPSLSTRTVAVRLNNSLSAISGSFGDFTWNGANGSAFLAAPKERLVVVYGMATPGLFRKIYRDQLSALVYGAMQQLPGAN